MLKGVHLPLRKIYVPRQHQDEGDFNNFRRLAGDAEFSNPAVGTVEFADANVRNEYQGGEDQRPHKAGQGEGF